MKLQTAEKPKVRIFGRKDKRQHPEVCSFGMLAYLKKTADSVVRMSTKPVTSKASNDGRIDVFNHHFAALPVHLLHHPLLKIFLQDA